jgi:hypothetical protein
MDGRRQKMKKALKRSLALVMVLLLLPALVACGADRTGTYIGKLDLFEMMGQALEGSGLEITDSVEASMTLELKKDNTFTLSMDAEGAIAALTEYFTASGSELITKMLEAQGYDSDSLEQLATLAGYGSYDEMVDALVAQLIEQMSQSLDTDNANTSFSGTYTIEENKLNLKADDGRDMGTTSCVFNQDGTISMKGEMNGEDIEIIFKKS